MRLERHPAVVAEDLPAIYAYIARDDPSAAERVLEAIGATLEQIATRPEIGVRYATKRNAFRDLRMLPVDRFPVYLVFYRITAEAVRVLYVSHGARHFPRVFQRERRD